MKKLWLANDLKIFKPRLVDDDDFLGDSQTINYVLYAVGHHL